MNPWAFCCVFLLLGVVSHADERATAESDLNSGGYLLALPVEEDLEARESAPVPVTEASPVDASKQEEEQVVLVVKDAEQPSTPPPNQQTREEEQQPVLLVVDEGDQEEKKPLPPPSTQAPVKPRFYSNRKPPTPPQTGSFFKRPKAEELMKILGLPHPPPKPKPFPIDKPKFFSQNSLKSTNSRWESPLSALVPSLMPALPSLLRREDGGARILPDLVFAASKFIRRALVDESNKLQALDKDDDDKKDDDDDDDDDDPMIVAVPVPTPIRKPAPFIRPLPSPLPPLIPPRRPHFPPPPPPMRYPPPYAAGAQQSAMFALPFHHISPLNVFLQLAAQQIPSFLPRPYTHQPPMKPLHPPMFSPQHRPFPRSPLGLPRHSPMMMPRLHSPFRGPMAAAPTQQVMLLIAPIPVPVPVPVPVPHDSVELREDDDDEDEPRVLLLPADDRDEVHKEPSQEHIILYYPEEEQQVHRPTFYRKPAPRMSPAPSLDRLRFLKNVFMHRQASHPSPVFSAAPRPLAEVLPPLVRQTRMLQVIQQRFLPLLRQM